MIYKFDVVSSTMEVAHRLAEVVDEEVVVWAKKQVAGAGRRGRKWWSPEGGLWFSIIMKDKQKVEYNKIAGLLAAFAVEEVLKKIVEDIWVKWPNDVIAMDRKIAGVLVDVSYLGCAPQYVVVGIGVNVNNTFNGTALEDVAISLKELTGRDYNLDSFLTQILDEISSQYQKFFADPKHIRKAFANKSKMVNRSVEVLMDKVVKKGLCIGIDDYGALIIKSNDELIKVEDVGNVERVIVS